MNSRQIQVAKLWVLEHVESLGLPPDCVCWRRVGILRMHDFSLSVWGSLWVHMEGGVVLLYCVWTLTHVGGVEKCGKKSGVTPSLWGILLTCKWREGHSFSPSVVSVIWTDLFLSEAQFGCPVEDELVSWNPERKKSMERDHCVYRNKRCDGLF